MSSRIKGMVNCVIELNNHTKTNINDPFNSIEVDVIFKKDDHEWRVPAFWRGGKNWSVRFSPPEVGIYSYSWTATPEVEFGAEVSGEVEAVIYTGSNKLIKHGNLQVSDNGHYFKFDDGTPFFWLADTWWKGLYKRVSLDDFKALTADRVSKNFNVVQIVMGTACDEQPFDPIAVNEGGYAWEDDYASINPAFFDYADQRIQHLVDSEVVPCLVCSWGFYVKFTGEEKMRRFVRNVVARYAAYPVVLVGCGEISLPYYLDWSESFAEDQAMQQEVWTRLCKYMKQINAFNRIVTTHCSASARREVKDETAIDFDMLQTGHFAWFSANNTIALVSSGYHKKPYMPVIVGEVSYEGHMDTNWADVQRYMFWISILNGACGHTYGAGGIFEMNSEEVPNGPSPHGGNYESTPWNVAAQLPGSKQLGISKTFLEKYHWWDFEPHQDWITPAAFSFTEDYDEWFDATNVFQDEMDKRAKSANGALLGLVRDVRPPRRLSFAAGIPGKVRFVYVPNREYNWSMPKIVQLEPDVLYEAKLFDPITGKVNKLGLLPKGVTEWMPPYKPSCQDYVLVLESVDQEILRKQNESMQSLNG